MTARRLFALAVQPANPTREDGQHWESVSQLGTIRAIDEDEDFEDEVGAVSEGESEG